MKDSYLFYKSKLNGDYRETFERIEMYVNAQGIDEPTKEVDGKIREEMIKIIKESALDRLVLVVTHNQDDIDALDAKIINL